MASQRPTRRRELHHRRNGARSIVGVDEVGRGPLAGPLVTAAVSLPLDRRLTWLSKLRDSKQLSSQQREQLAPLIREGSLQWSLGWVSAAELDELRMTNALRLACRRAIDGLQETPDVVLADGRDDLRLAYPTEMIVKGDASVASIAAASIVAKVARDRRMVELDAEFPGYGFARHKGYGSAQHLAALQSLGPCPEHRRSFSPVANLIQPRMMLDRALDAAGS